MRPLALLHRLRSRRTDRTQITVSREELFQLRDAVMRDNQSAYAASVQRRTGRSRSTLHGQGVEFAEARPYVPGDDIRHIDWRLSARTGKPLTKLYTEERELPVYILIDQRDSMFFGAHTAFKSVMSARIGALLAWMALAKNKPVGGAVFGEKILKIKVKRNRQSILGLLETIAEANNLLNIDSAVGMPLSHVIDTCRGSIPPGSLVVIVSDFTGFDAATGAAVAAIAQRNMLKLIKISDTLEDDMTVLGAVGISDGREVTQIAFSQHVRSHYQQQRSAWQSQLQTCANSCKLNLLSFTQENFAKHALLEQLELGIYR